MSSSAHRCRKGHTNTTHTLGVSIPTGKATGTVRARERAGARMEAPREPAPRESLLGSMARGLSLLSSRVAVQPRRRLSQNRTVLHTTGPQPWTLTSTDRLLDLTAPQPCNFDSNSVRSGGQLGKRREGSRAEADELFAHELDLARLRLGQVEELAVRHHHVHLGGLLGVAGRRA